MVENPGEGSIIQLVELVGLVALFHTHPLMLLRLCLFLNLCFFLTLRLCLHFRVHFLLLLLLRERGIIEGRSKEARPSFDSRGQQGGRQLEFKFNELEVVCTGRPQLSLDGRRGRGCFLVRILGRMFQIARAAHGEATSRWTMYVKS